jgi:hypothetical protein
LKPFTSQKNLFKIPAQTSNSSLFLNARLSPFNIPNHNKKEEVKEDNEEEEEEKLQEDVKEKVETNS